MDSRDIIDEIEYVKLKKEGRGVRSGRAKSFKYIARFVKFVILYLKLEHIL